MGGSGVERRARNIAQTLHGQQLGRRRDRSVKLKADPRRRLMRRRIGNFEQAGRHRKLAPRRQVGSGLSEPNLGVAADDVNGEIRVFERRQATHRIDDAVTNQRVD